MFAARFSAPSADRMNCATAATFRTAHKEKDLAHDRLQGEACEAAADSGAVSRGETGDGRPGRLRNESLAVDVSRNMKPAAPGTEATGAVPAADADSVFKFDPKALHISAGMDPEVFRRIIGKRKSTIKVCYRKALAKDPKAQGDVKLKFTITPTGRVSAAEVLGSTLKDADAEECLVRTIQRLRFPVPPEGGARVEVEYPFHFIP